MEMQLLAISLSSDYDDDTRCTRYSVSTCHRFRAHMTPCVMFIRARLPSAFYRNCTIYNVLVVRVEYKHIFDEIYVIIYINYPYLETRVNNTKRNKIVRLWKRESEDAHIFGIYTKYSDIQPIYPKKACINASSLHVYIDFSSEETLKNTSVNLALE